MNMQITGDASSRTVDHYRNFSPAIEAASHAMSVWTQGRVQMSLDEICEMPLEEVGSAIAHTQETAIIVSLGVVGEVGGQFLFTLDDAGASKLAGLLLDRAPRAIAEWGEIERSALLETGNILGSAYLSALTNLTGVRLFPTPPEVLRDYLGCALEQAVMLQALQADTVLLARTCFKHGGESVDWNLLFVPSPELLELLRNSAAVNSASTKDRT
jgi:chemotaxis protein CheC